jgi:hypothetical protein
MTTHALLNEIVRAGSVERSLGSFCVSLVTRLSESRLWRAAMGNSPLAPTKTRERNAADGGARVASETAYYANPAVQAMARMSAGVRLPSGKWMRVAGSDVPMGQAENIVRRLFPTMRERTLYVFTLHTDLDVDDFERCFGLSQRSLDR